MYKFYSTKPKRDRSTVTVSKRPTTMRELEFMRTEYDSYSSHTDQDLYRIISEYNERPMSTRYWNSLFND